MKYSNPTIPEGINTSKVHPLREFALLTVGALSLVGVLVITVGYFGGQLGLWLVSVETEVKWAQRLGESLDLTNTPAPLDRYLNGLGERVSTVMGLPEEMPVKLIYRDEDTVNAFATVGGTILLYRGLLKKIPHENALVMLIAHEAAHIKHRDPIGSIGSAIGIQATLSLLLSVFDVAPLEDIGLFTQLAFSRDMEQEADIAALQAVVDIYSHASGADDLFKIIQADRSDKGSSELPVFLSTHPSGRKRIETIAHIAQEQGWRRDLPTTPLPAQYNKWFAGTD